MPTILGVITARGGSKGIPGKNIKLLGGKPLIAYTIEAARASGIFDRLILSTDDGAIADVARKYGAEVPFLRPVELALDTTPHLPVMQHAAGWLKKHEGYSSDYIAIHQPTSPLRQPRHLQEAFGRLVESGADSVIGVAEIPGHHHPLWALRRDHEGFATLFVSGDAVRNRAPRRQELGDTAYTNSGAIYMFKTALLFDPARPNFYGERVAAYIIEDRYNINIDAMEDWRRAEEALERLSDHDIV